ncbi:erythrocyte membrane protein 1, PfEMP1, putative [Plasmodium sp. DRC-Itaito]|nr:erythrocyte membrane protein 1, PfEMP1, putative [Plasmodium sp. DRC-Itaito]
MAPKPKAVSEPDYSKVNNVKDLFDEVGKYVEKQVHNYALERGRERLHGHLEKAVFIAKDRSESTETPQDPCELKYEYHTNVTDRVIEPCKHNSEERFSNTEGADCNNSREASSNERACAPFRRLHVCDRNLEQIKPEKITSTDYLLVDVCQAAKYEGESIEKYHDKYKETNNDSNLCIMLARSFADIGDIVRGKDMYRGYDNEEKDKRRKLEKNLQKIFKKIYNTLEEPTKGKYDDDTREGKFFQLREDWWNANRKKVWDALTCQAPGDAQYVGFTCGGGSSMAHRKCRCDGNVDTPTYFDYVPQYLRWFHEWAEEFCRKKKKYVEIVKKYCRGEKEGEKYCSFNGYDCEETISRIGKFVIGNYCTTCSVACRPYEKWIDNQREEFEKQKEKYKTEIQKYENIETSSIKRRGRSEPPNKYEGYDRKFYGELKRNKEYGDVNKFLELLREETECKGINEDGGKIDFNEQRDDNNEYKGTFYRSQYCQRCPECGVKKEGKTFKSRNRTDKECQQQNLYTHKEGEKPTVINVLIRGKGQEEIEKKINEFCETSDSNNEKLNEEWKCYYENASNEACILENEKRKTDEEPREFQKSFNDFFNVWVANLLSDTIEWRKDLNKCMTAAKAGKCEKGCKGNCECFKKWIKKKQQEWEKLKDQYDKQNDMGPFGKYWTLESTLDEHLIPIIEKNNSDLASIGEIKKVIQKNKEKYNLTRNDVNAIDALIKYELEDAETCVTRDPQQYCNQKAKPRISPASRALEPIEETIQDEEEEEDEDDEEEEEGGNHDEVEAGASDSSESPTDQETTGVEGPKGEGTPRVEDNKICEIVADIMKTDTLQAACSQKYGHPHRNYGWKCIPSGSNNEASDTTRESERAIRAKRQAADQGAPSDATKGGICVPPRRRKMYIEPLEKWVTTTVAATDSGAREGQSQGLSTQADSSRAPKDPLLAAFVKSAAVETWFLWDRYKKEKEIERRKKEEEKRLQGPSLGLEIPGNTEETPEETLKSGEIPEDFLRQMFYTLGDYKDIFFGVNDPDVKNALQKSVVKTKASDSTQESAEQKSVDDEDPLDKIRKAIDKALQTSDTSSPIPSPSQPPSGKPGVIDRKEWWTNTLGPAVWNGMICALTYKDNGKEAPTQDPTLKGALLDDKGEPKNDNTYEKAAIDANDTEEMQTNADIHAPEGTKLTQFVEYPAFFRWLHEWGNEFCAKRTELLDKIEKECMKDSGNSRPGGTNKIQRYSGDGEDCDKIRDHDYSKVSDLESSGCPKSCSFYRGWIERKKYELNKQSNAYSGQKGKCPNGSKKDGIYSCGILKENCNTAADFLNRLKSGPCKNEDGTGNGEENIDFTKTEQTFKHTDYCGTCPLTNVKCEASHCKSEVSAAGCNGETLTAANFDKKIKNGNDVFMRFSDMNTSGFEDLQNSCENADIFKGIRKEEWKCGKVCGVHVCGLKKPSTTNNNKEIDGKQILLIRPLVKRWLEYFLIDYNRIRKKLKHCINKGDGSKCICGCEQKTKCVQAWIEKKRKEWEDIKNRFNEQYNGENSEMKSNVINFPGDLIRQLDVNKTLGPSTTLDKLEKSLGCNCSQRSGNGEHSDKKDIVECLFDKLEKLKDKIKTCPDQPTGTEPCPQSTPQQPLEDDEDDYPSLEAPEENGKTIKQHPSFCTIEDEPAEKGVETCDAPPNEENKDEEDTKDQERDPPELSPEIPKATSDSHPSQTPVLKPEEEAPAPEVGESKESPVKPASSPSPDAPKEKSPKKEAKPKGGPTSIPLDPTPFSLAHVSPSFVPLTVGMGLLALSYWLIRKKTKPPVDLFSVIDIPKGEYDIPTDLSSNRYVPYATRKHRGKRYIYIEGDTDEEKYAFMSDTTDITSSSESEYEEIDLYVPHGPPKYKTLIEVVLEPSTNAKNTPNSDKTIPTSGNNIPSDDTPTPITDEDWNELKENFISQYLQNEQKDMLNILDNNVDNNTQPNTLYDNMDEKPFIMSIHDRNLYTGEEYSYDMLNSGIHPSSGNLGSYGDNPIPISGTTVPYSGIDLINDALSGTHDIYDEILKRKENELFGTNHVKHTSIHNFAQPARDDPLHNQIQLFHKWLDRHRDMCEKWENNHERLNKLKEEWEKDTNSGNINPSDNIPSDIPNGKLSDIPNDKLSDTPSGKLSDTPSGNNKQHSDIPYVLHTDVSIQIDMDNPKTTNIGDTDLDNSTMDNILDDLDKKFYEPNYYDIYEDDIYYDVNDEHNTSNVNPNNNMDVPSRVQIELDVRNGQMVEEKYPISDIWGI